MSQTFGVPAYPLSGNEGVDITPPIGRTTTQAIADLGAKSPAITGGTIDGTVIGGTTPAAAHFTTLSATGAVTLSNASISATALPTADPHVVGRLWANSGVVTVSAG